MVKNDLFFIFSVLLKYAARNILKKKEILCIKFVFVTYLKLFLENCNDNV